jgi:predicted nucleotide-binding protein
VYLSTSVEERELGHRVADKLRDIADVTVWDQLAFTAGSQILDRLMRVADDADLALFFLPSSGTAAHQRGLYFEAGLIAAKIGLPRTLFLTTGPESDGRRVPAILQGVDVWPCSWGLTVVVKQLRAFVRASGSRRREPQRQPRRPRGRRSVRKPPSSQESRDAVFVSYSHADERWLRALKVALAVQVRQENVLLWDDSLIQPGSKWKEEIAAAIDRARVAVLLVSPHFLASPFIANHELPPLLAGAERRGVRVLWVLVSACSYRKTAIGEYQAAHNTARPLDTLKLSKRNIAWVEISDAVEEAFGRATTKNR